MDNTNLLTPIQMIAEQAPVFVLVLMRVGGVVTAGPLLGLSSIPLRIRVLITLVLALAVYPLVGPVAEPPATWLGLVVAAGGELILGLSMGFLIKLMITGIQVGAQLVGQQMGLAMARIVNPLTEEDNDVLDQFFVMLVTLIYVLINGHVMLIQALARTFRMVPLLSVEYHKELLAAMVDVLTTSFMLGIRIAGPALAAIFLATLALGFISRTMPQLNILAAGFPIRITLSLVLLIASIGSLCILFQEKVLDTLGRIGTLFG
ncbi:MAG: flagellar biosynthetic protein FliR [Sedimentisphaerales bacterium]|nr:flagellar biosynthetic protein FliR [Sedimentisphaerales bacterium]